MFWFSIAFLGYFCFALAAILDKFILTKSVPKPVVYTFYSTIFMFGALLLWPFGVELLDSFFDWGMALVSGLAFGFGLWAFYNAQKKGEATHISPFNGAFTTISVFLLSWFFLSELLTSIQVAGVIVLIFASFLLSFERSLTHNGFHVGFVWAILSGILFATSHVTAKYLYEVYPFLTGFMWTRATTGFVGLLLLAYPSVRRVFKKNKKKKNKTIAKRHSLAIVIVTKIFGILGVIFVQFAAAIGSVTLVFALSGMQWIMMFAMVYLFTKLTPKFFKEYFTKKEIAVQLIALVLVALGSAFFVL